MTAALAIMVATMATAMVVMALRLSGAKAAEVKAKAAKVIAEDNASRMSEEFAIFKERAMAQRWDLLQDIDRLQDDLEKCDTPGSRRERLRSLLSKAKASPVDTT